MAYISSIFLLFNNNISHLEVAFVCVSTAITYTMCARNKRAQGHMCPELRFSGAPLGIRTLDLGIKSGVNVTISIGPNAHKFRLKTFIFGLYVLISGTFYLFMILIQNLCTTYSVYSFIYGRISNLRALFNLCALTFFLSYQCFYIKFSTLFIYFTFGE